MQICPEAVRRAVCVVVLAAVAALAARAVAAPPGGTLSVIDAGAVGDGVADDSGAIQAAIDSVRDDAGLIGVYFPPGHYRIAGDVSMRDGVSLFGDHAGLSVIQADPDAERVVGNDVWGEPVNDFVVQDLHFYNARLSFYGSQRKRYSISRCIFVATHADAHDHFQARLDRSERVVLEDCIFLRQDGGFSSAFSSFRTNGIEYRRNIVGLDLGNIGWLGTEWSGFDAWDDVIGKLRTLRSRYALDNDQGWFRSGVKIHTDNSDVLIIGNIFNGSPAAVGVEDHVMYIHNNDTGQIDIVSNWMRGWETDSTGGLKIRNNDGPFNVVANHFVNTPILGYIHDNDPRTYNGTLVYRNLFTFDDFSSWGPINYWNQLTGGSGTEALNEFADNVFDCGGSTSWGSVWFRNVTNPEGFAVYPSNVFADGTPVPISNVQVTHGRVEPTDGAPDPDRIAPFADARIPMLAIPEYGRLSFDDLDEFVARFLANDLSADCDENGVLNLDDVGCFVACFLAGCP